MQIDAFDEIFKRYRELLAIKERWAASNTSIKVLTGNQDYFLQPWDYMFKSEVWVHSRKQGVQSLKRLPKITGKNLAEILCASPIGRSSTIYCIYIVRRLQRGKQMHVVIVTPPAGKQHFADTIWPWEK